MLAVLWSTDHQVFSNFDKRDTNIAYLVSERVDETNGIDLQNGVNSGHFSAQVLSDVFGEELDDVNEQIY